MTNKLILLFLSTVIIFQYSFSQLSSGVIAPNWTMTDINDSTHTLYDYLDQGKSVVIDVSATWCGPCWSYHNTHALRDVYNNYGPSGTDEIMVFFIEGDANTTLDDLFGTGSNTLGDWVTGTPYPIINSTSINNSYQINYFPTIYLICPDRVIKEIGQLSATDIYAEAQLCPLLTTTINDAKVFEIIKPIGDYCAGTVLPKFKIQNYGTATLSSLDIISIIDGSPVDTFMWTGSLNMYETEQITLNQTPLLIDGNHTFEFAILNPNDQIDDDITNNNMTENFSTNSLGTEVTVKVKTDGNPSQTSWDIKLGTTIVASGGNFVSSNHIYIDYACLYEDSCYTFNVYDSGNNGLDGNSFGLIFWNGNTITSFPASIFNNDYISLDFCLSSTIIENDIKNEINIFPNPVKEVLFIELENIISSDAEIIINDIFGKTIKSEKNILYHNNTLKINVSELSSGMYNISIISDNKITSKKIIIID